MEMNGNIRNIHWGTYNYKIEAKKLTTGYIPSESLRTGNLQKGRER